jgi:pSer/pThr/pTyr-binding forkhead associated (FHA) protein
MRERTVSREHAELTLVPEGVRVRDLGSRNGTFYRDQRVESLIVAPGARVRLGKAELRIDAERAVPAHEENAMNQRSSPWHIT